MTAGHLKSGSEQADGFRKMLNHPAGLEETVGWVERSDTHRGRSATGLFLKTP
jgi:hypothetical protein